MKKIMIPMLMLVLVSFGVSDTKLTKKERNAAVTEMTTTHDHLLRALKGLSEAQLNFKSEPSSWSIAECTEHITIAEHTIFGMLEGALQKEADPSKRSEVKLSDEEILTMIVNRTYKAKAPEPFQPSGKYGSHKETLKAFKTKRKAHITYIKKTDDDLRNHYATLPFGVIDAYQILLFMSAHTERHILQIEEVMAHENFPKQ